MSLFSEWKLYTSQFGRPPNSLRLLSFLGNMQNKFHNFVLVEDVLGWVISEPYRAHMCKTLGSVVHWQSVHHLACMPVSMLGWHCVMVQEGLMEENAQRFFITAVAALEN